MLEGMLVPLTVVPDDVDGVAVLDLRKQLGGEVRPQESVQHRVSVRGGAEEVPQALQIVNLAVGVLDVVVLVDDAHELANRLDPRSRVGGADRRVENLVEFNCIFPSLGDEIRLEALHLLNFASLLVEFKLGVARAELHAALVAAVEAGALQIHVPSVRDEIARRVELAIDLHLRCVRVPVLARGADLAFEILAALHRQALIGHADKVVGGEAHDAERVEGRL